MAILATELEKAERAKEAAAKRSDGYRAELLSVAALRNTEDDFDKRTALSQRVRTIEQNLSDAEAVLAQKVARLEAARAAEEEATADRTHAEAAKLAARHGKLIAEIAADSKALASKLAREVECRAELDAANAARGRRPFIQDGEERLRFQSAIEEIREPLLEEVWVDANGQHATKSAIASGHAKKVHRQVGVKVVRSGRNPFMPTRFANSIKLYDLAGEPVWPPR